MKTLALLVSPVATVLFASCASAPPTSTGPAGGESELRAENDALRTRVTELEGKLGSSTTAHDQAITAARESESELDRERAAREARADADRREAEREAAMPKPGVTYSIAENDGLVVGKADALVTIVVATEADCPFCWKAEDSLAALRATYKSDLRIIYQARIVHPQTATEPARIFCAAGKQKKGEEMWKALRARYDNRTGFARADLLADAESLKLNLKRLEKDMDGDCTDIVKKQDEYFASIGVNGTPTFFINGKTLRGAQPVEKFTEIIDAELLRARALVASGISKKKLYRAIQAFGETP